VAGAVAALLNANFLLELIIVTGLPPGRSMVSELSAVGQPDAWAFQVGDGVAGVLAAALALTLLRAGMHRLLAWCALVFGVTTTLSALLPLPCTIGACAGGTWRVLLHDGPSVVGTTAAVLGSWLLVRAEERGALRTATVVIALTATLTGALFAFSNLGPALPATGVIQRVQILSLSAWLVLLGLLSPDPGSGWLSGPSRRAREPAASRLRPPRGADASRAGRRR
jgi:uncharacterized protein DUF998